jgi:hypothetical protein
MKKQKLVPAIVYVTSGFCLFEYIDFLSGMEPPINHILYILIAGAALFGIASTLSFFTLRGATMFALSAAVVSWPFLWRQFGMTFGRNWLWLLTYYPITSMAVSSLIVSSVYAVFQLTLFFRPPVNLSERKAWWTLPAAVLYTGTIIIVANWPSIWSLCFKLRYGN